MNDAGKANLKKRLMKFLDDAAKNMTQNPENGGCFFLNITPYIAVIVAWIPGYENEPGNKYISEGYGLEASVRLRDSSYFTEDWSYINEGCMVSLGEADEKDSFQGTAEWLIQEMGGHYLEPKILVTLPDGRTVDLIDDSYWVEEDDEIRCWVHDIENEKRDLTELWWAYHSGLESRSDISKYLRVYAQQLAFYYGDFDEDFQQLISVEELTELLYQAIIKEY